MLLKKLAEYERSLKSGVPDYYRREVVRWAYHLDTKEWEKLGTEDDPVTHLVPSVNRTNAGTAMLVADTAEYVFGLPNENRPDKAKKYRDLYVGLLMDAMKDGLAEAKAAFDAFVGRAYKLPKDLRATDRLVFVDRDEIITNRAAVQDWWAAHQAARYVTGPVMPCACCGELRGTVGMVDEWLKGVPEALQGKCTLITANNESAERYGRTKSHGACLCYPCARDSARGLNRLIADETATLKVGPVLVVAWGAGVPVRELLTTPSREAAALLRAAPFEGETNVLVLVARQSRAVAVSFGVYPAEELGGRLAAWVEAQGDAPHGLLDEWFPPAEEGGKKFRRAGLVTLLHPTGEVKKLPPGTVADVAVSALTGTPLPPAVRAAAEYVVALGPDAWRNEKRPDPLPAAAALVKLTTLYSPEGHMAEKINMADTAAYRCGQLLGHLERLQRAAVPGINRTVADTALRTTAAAPTAVLGEALTDARAHLAKLARLNRAGPFRDAINECIDGLTVPDRFTADDQAAFSLGYYSIATAKPAPRDDAA